MRELTFELNDAASLDELVRTQLRKGRAFLPFVPGFEPPVRIALVLALEGWSHALEAEVVYAREVEPGAGLGLQLAPVSEAVATAMLEAARAAVNAAARAPEAAPEPARAPEPEPAAMELTFDAPAVATELTFDLEAPAEQPALSLGEASPEASAPSAPHDEVGEGEGEGDEGDEGGDEGEGAAEAGRGPEHAQRLHERMRALSGAEQRRLAVAGNLRERVLLERFYGPNVWDALLTNTKLTLPEVARIARKGTLPKPQLELIASNAGWLASPEVQRALLSNPRSTPLVVNKVLRALSKADLAKVPAQTAYPLPVRQAAKYLLKP